MTDVFPVSSKEILRRMADDAYKKNEPYRSQGSNLKPPAAVSCAPTARSARGDPDIDAAVGGSGSGLRDKVGVVGQADENGGDVSSDRASLGSAVNVAALSSARLAWPQRGPKQRLQQPGSKGPMVKTVAQVCFFFV